MSDDVGDGKIVAEEKIFETEGGNKNQTAGGDPRLSRALYQERMARQDRGDATAKRIHRANKRQDQSERTEYIHGSSAYPPAMPGRVTCCFSVLALVTEVRWQFAPGAASYLEAHFACTYFGNKPPIRSRSAFH